MYPFGSIILEKGIFNHSRNLDFCGTISTKFVEDLNAMYNFLYSSWTELSKNDYSDKVIILIDDVLHSGKTLTYAFKNFLNTSIKKMAVLVLIDRNHNSFPVKANYVGLSLSTTLKEYIEVVLKGNNKGVYLS